VDYDKVYKIKIEVLDDDVRLFILEGAKTPWWFIFILIFLKLLSC
jgi:hypothetical protein